MPSLVVPVLASRFWQKCQRENQKLENKIISKPNVQPDLTENSETWKNSTLISTTNNIIQPEIIKKNLQTFIFGVFILGLICTLLLGFLAPFGFWIIDPFARYSAFSLQTIWALSGMLIFNSLSIFLGNLNILLGGFRVELAISLGNFIVAMICYFSFIPTFGILGAAFASLIIYGIDIFLRIFFLRQTWTRYNKITNTNQIK